MTEKEKIVMELEKVVKDYFWHIEKSLGGTKRKDVKFDKDWKDFFDGLNQFLSDYVIKRELEVRINTARLLSKKKFPYCISDYIDELKEELNG